MDRLIDQSQKFLSVTRYLLKQYGKAVVSDAEAREFFTEIYLKQHPSGSRQRGLVSSIPTRALGEIFPGIEAQHVQLLNRYDALLANRYVQEADSLVTPLEMATLCAIVAHRKPTSIFEVGTYKGLTLASMALNSPVDCDIQTIDNYWFELAPEVARIFEERKIERYHTDSKSFDFESYKGSVDLVFVDGSHVAPEVEIDTKHALEIVAPGGLVIWHDFNPEHPEVVRVLSDLAGERTLVHVKGTAIVILLTAEL